MDYKAETEIIGSGATIVKSSYLCDLCGFRRFEGKPLLSRVDMTPTTIWVCADCQHKLARHIDDEGTLGG